MNPTIRHFFRILDNGNIVFYNPEMFENQKISMRGKEGELIMKERVKRPSFNQTGYYFGGILRTCLTCEMFSHYSDVQDIHKELFAPMFLSYQTKVFLGKASWMQQHIRSFGELTKLETSEFIDKVLRWCEENEIVILPAEQYVEKFYKEVTKK